ncbi:MAG TPA: hypothetical protein VFV13_07210 [Acidimicrobiia bacterium]|nr:hypothetical protein [Acidimicrobiia bacterium]
MSVTRFLLPGLVMAVVAMLGPAAGVGGASSSNWDVVSSDSYFRDDADITLTEWALGRFDRAGLSVPPVSIAFHHEKAACRGQNGYFQPGDPHRVDICGFNWDRFLVTPRKVILHELAHAWVHENLSEMARQEFLDLRGLERWRDEEAPWGEQGMEHAAEIMAWRLMDEEISMTSIGETDTSSLARAYQLLTRSSE